MNDRCIKKSSRKDIFTNMTIQIAEQRKRDLTDKYVIVIAETPELKRFEGLTGTVKTVNMNGRALVQFDGPVDISWYDIDPDFLEVVDAPLPKKATPVKAKEAAPAKKAPAAKAAGKSPLELAREQAAGGGGQKLSPLEMAKQQGAKGSAQSAPTGDKKLSPLEMARQQGAKGSEKSTPTGDAPPETAPSKAASDKKLSPLELARQQGAAGASSHATTEEAPATENATPEKAASEKATSDDSNLSPLELARKQGAFKG
ncbi:hypothetical protein MNBD_PLANCTO02-3217 [hydrothermal vent metagenome]|uniref:Uncharacterized protein n=1 Tax=hydrothermal vent metagenome TaxID=652676 RepID=A0A3B1DE97_9ZZZZ